MISQPCPRFSASLRTFARVAGVIVTAIGTLVLLGWLLDVSPLQSIVPGLALIQANAALCFVFAGLSLGLLDRVSPWPRIGCITAACVWVLAALTLVEYLLDPGWALDQSVFSWLASVQANRERGRMAFTSALVFLMLSSARLILETGRLHRLAQLLAISAGFICLLALTGDAFHFFSLQEAQTGRRSPLVAVSAFLLLSLATLAARPEHGWMTILTSPFLGGMLARRLLPVAVLVPFLLGWLRLLGEQAGWYTAPFGLMLYVLAAMVLLAVCVTWYADMLNRLDLRRTEVEEELRRSERRFRALIENSHDAITLNKPDGTIVYASPSADRVLGYTPAELVGINPFTLIHPEDVAKLQTRLVDALAAPGSVVSDEHRVRQKDGSWRWVESADTNLLADPSVDAIVGNVRDITARKKAEAALREFSEFNRQIIASAREGIIVLDENLRYQLFNPFMEELSGTPAQAVLGKHPWEAFPAFQRDMVEPILRRVLAGETLIHPDSPSPQTRTGQAGWFSTQLSPLRNAQGAVIGIIATTNDVTARKSAELDLRTANQTLQALIQAAPLAVIVTDLAGQVQTWNPSAETMFGWTAQQVLGQPNPTMPDDKREEDAQVLARVQAGESIVCLETRRRTRTGSLRDVILSIAPVYGPDGTLQAVMRILSDVTERKALEEKFRQSQKMDAIGKLAGGIAHDFNNLLTIIMGYSQVLHRELPESEPHRELAHEITKAGEQAASLTRQLLAFSRQQMVSPRLLDLGSVIAHSEKMLGRLMGEDVRLQVAHGPSLAPVKADPGQIEQLLLNLAVNARDAMPRGGTLLVATRNARVNASASGLPAGSYVLLTVADTGVGMDEATRLRIFEPFFTTKGDKGTGLGLATVYGIMKQHNGHIEVDSQPGAGTVFRLYFPATAGQPLPVASGVNMPDLPGGDETILLVEDESAVRAMTRRVLTSCGYVVLEASNGQEALEVATEHREPIHLLMTDVIMPGMGGREMADRFRELHPESRLLFMSGYTDDAILRHGVRQAEVAFLQKPFGSAAIAQKVREVLDGKPDCQD